MRSNASDVSTCYSALWNYLTAVNDKSCFSREISG